MSSIERRFIAWLSKSTVADQASEFLEIESFRDDPNADTSPANLGIFTVFNAYYDKSDGVGEGVEGVLILGPVQKPGEQPLEAQNPKDDQTPPE